MTRLAWFRACITGWVCVSLVHATGVCQETPEVATIPVVPVGLPGPIPVPTDNPLTPAKIDLGQKLFFEQRLSADQTTSCATCHDPQKGFATSEPLAIGIGGQRTTRNAPTLINRAYGTSQFWDGRAASLEEQALQPLQNPLEMGNSLEAVLEVLRADPEYHVGFANAFGGDREAAAITTTRLAQAIASFERTLLAGNSPVDRFQSGEYEALSAAERRGLWVFEGRGKCWQCHSGPNYTDERFHNTGHGYDQASRDPGRQTVTGDDADRYRFKTPTLRTLTFTMPYMHDGALNTLEEVVEFYSIGGSPQDPQLDPKMDPLFLEEQEQSDLVAFLKALSR